MQKINTARIKVRVMTTVVAPTSSSRVDQETLLSSALNSPKNFLTALYGFIVFFQGRRDLNPQDGIWSLAVCQLTDAPSKFLSRALRRNSKVRP